MSELKLISPLLDHMIVEKERFGQDGRPYYTLRNEQNNERYVLKTMSLPESDSRIRALILSGAYSDEQSVHEYYGKLAEDVKAELELGQTLAASGSFAGALSFQVQPKDSGVGYDIYILYPLNVSLAEFLATNAITGLRALNLGIDICDALTACRDAGYLYQNLKPENIFLMSTGRFLVGGLGLTSTEFLQYASVPEEYIGVYSAPEMSDITACPNLTIDLYALGMVLYRIYNGNHGPFEDESTNAAMADKLRLTGKPLPSPIYADYELAEIILKACAFKVEDRYQSPDELKQALKLYMQRNEVADDLIVPPIVADLDPIPLIDEDMEAEPIRMTEIDQLDDDFRQNFAPDMSGAGEDVLAIEPEEPAPLPIFSAELSDEVEDTVASVATEDDAPPSQEALQYDPNQMDFDSLIASVNDIVREQIEGEPIADEDVEEEAESPVTAIEYDDEEAEIGYVDDDSYDEDEPEDEEPSQAKPKDPKKAKLKLWGIIGGSLLVIALLGYFLLSWYFIKATELKTISTSPTQITLELVSDDNPEYFEVTCADSFGNVYEGARSGNQYCFSGLREKTSYTISVNAAKYHAFSAAAPVLTETTEEYTVISNVAFERLNTDGDIMLSFDHKGPVPSQWKLTYAKKDGSDPHSYRFDGESYQINGLELYETYIFTFEDADGIFIDGEKTIEYQVFPRVTASDFAITNIDGNVVTLSWTCEDVIPEKWGVVCTAEGMDNISKTTSETTLDITVPDFSTKYTFYLNAKGMDAPEQIVLKANPIVITNLTAKSDGEGNLVVSWETPVGEPSGQWRLSYQLKHGCYGVGAQESIPSVAVEEKNTVTLSNLPANAEFILNLLAVDTETNSYPDIYGTTSIETMTGDTVPFDEYQILPAAPYGDGHEADSLIAFWEKPDKDTWDYRDLLSQRRNTYRTGEKIAMCIQIDSCDVSVAVASDTVHVTYAVRTVQGDVVAADSRELKWSAVWFDRRHTGLVPMPMTRDANGNPTAMTGEFICEVYINGKLLAVKGFVIEA